MAKTKICGCYYDDDKGKRHHGLYIHNRKTNTFTILNKKLATTFNTSTIVFYTHIIMFLSSACFIWQFIKPHPIAIAILAFAGLMLLVLGISFKARDSYD